MPRMKTPPRMDLKTLLAPIAEDMQQVDMLIRQRLSSEVALINQIGAHIIAGGGKRMRPAIVLLTARALGCTTQVPPRFAAIIEFIHTATLLHDDVVDSADRRRGLKTANAVWGNAGAVLSGDFLYSRSFQMMVDAGRMDIMRVLADTTNAIAEGEVLQLMTCGDPDVTEARYLRVIELKTARLFEASARLGAIAADTGDETQRRMAAYGHHLGMAFQLVDDLLDYIADSEVSGKNLGTDLAEGKPTLPLIYAMQNGTRPQRDLIYAAIRDGRVENLSSVLDAVESTGGITYSAALAKQHVEQAINALGELPESPCQQAMMGLARFATERVN